MYASQSYWRFPARRLLAGILLLGGLVSGCSEHIANSPKPGMIDLMPPVTAPGQPPSTGIQTMAFARNGLERQAIILQADAKVPLRPMLIPAHATLAFALAMPFDLGDGAMARVYFRSREGEFLLMEHRLDPARKREDRQWFEVSLDLENYAGKQGEIVLQASADTGDSTGDWIGWGDVQICTR